MLDPFLNLRNFNVFLDSRNLRNFPFDDFFNVLDLGHFNNLFLKFDLRLLLHTFIDLLDVFRDDFGSLNLTLNDLFMDSNLRDFDLGGGWEGFLRGFFKCIFLEGENKTQ